MLEQGTGLYLFGAYALFIIGLVWFTRNRKESSEDFLVMNRSLGVFRGSLSMAVSWIWAPAVFICSLQAYTQGLAGIFWFTLPNILTFFVFAPFALRLRKVAPEGYTLTSAFRSKFPKGSAYKAARIVALGYQLGAVIINCVAGATLISLLSGISYSVGVILMATVALIYSLISGLRASVVSDVIQMLMVLIIALFIVPWAINSIGGLEVLEIGLGGVSGEFSNMFNPAVAFSFGIATTIGLISGPVADQMFSQRAFAAKKGSVTKIFVYAGLLFGIVPIVLSLLGFIGAAGEINGLFSISDPQMVGPEVVNFLLPKWALGMFALMAFAGLTSTLDSAFTAIGSIFAIDLSRSEDNETNRISIARKGMIAFAILGIGLGLLQPQLIWVFLIYGALASSIFFPAFFLLFWGKLTDRGAFVGILAGLIAGTPLSIYANTTENTNLIVAASIFGLVIAGIVAFIVSLSNQK